ncbi:ribosome-associated protein Y [Candidatus Scalindua japonica]|uniref:Ribosome hibernation promoting factor n=1 Tax=Candidatus Scalindua japonica TaxID=1284222 RepID=A0A286U1Q4_9BACT|nr:ribosome-associated translation inhibitor RaiA [Candidatus Scalindua japonica]GAX62064.1 ribosome-associated protein Y [Candidatus Scalindua japonica]
MEIIIHSRHLDATEAIKNYINKKASKLTKYSSKINKIQYTLKIEGNNNIVEAICSAARATLVAEAIDADMYAAIDLVMDKLEKQIIKQKEKLKQPRRSRKGEAPIEEEEDEG